MTEPSRRTSRATIDDVAGRAGVHRSTVSRALRGDVRITPETRDLIQRIADELRYEPNLLAKGLAGHGTSMIGILTPRLRDGFYVNVVSRQQELLVDRGFCALMGVTQGGYGPEERRVISSMVSRGVDGLIVNHVPGDPETNEMLMGLAAGGLPIGMLGIHHLKGIDCVGYDTSAMVGEIVRHLIGLGHRRIGIIAWSTHSRRVVGYREALSQAGIRYRRDYVFTQDDSHEALAPLAEKILSSANRPTALITSEDALAARLIMEFGVLGCAVPGGMSVTGFDDSWFSALCRVPLTTMRLPQKEMGETLARLVVGRIALPMAERVSHAKRVDYAGKLIVRQSSRPPDGASGHAS